MVKVFKTHHPPPPSPSENLQSQELNAKKYLPLQASQIPSVFRVFK